MFSLVTIPLDRWIIRLAAARFRPPRVPEPRTAEAQRLIEAPEFFDVIPPKPALEFHSEQSFSFHSPVTTPWAPNNLVRGRLVRAGSDWRQKPSVILLHGWNAEASYHWLFPWLAARFAQAGINAAMFELPYHGRRKGRANQVQGNFLSSDLFHTVQATQQALADARALLAWLRAEGSPAIGFYGFSLGAWLAGVLACHEPRTAFAALLSPVVSLGEAVETLPFCKPLQASLNGDSAGLAKLDLKASQPRPARDRILIVECLQDQFVAAESIERLWRAWNQPVIWRVPQGHISIMLSLPVMRKSVKWLRQAMQPG